MNAADEPPLPPQTLRPSFPPRVQLVGKLAGSLTVLAVLAAPALCRPHSPVPTWMPYFRPLLLVLAASCAALNASLTALDLDLAPPLLAACASIFSYLVGALFLATLVSLVACTVLEVRRAARPDALPWGHHGSETQLSVTLAQPEARYGKLESVESGPSQHDSVTTGAPTIAAYRAATADASETFWISQGRPGRTMSMGVGSGADTGLRILNVEPHQPEIAALARRHRSDTVPRSPQSYGMRQHRAWAPSMAPLPPVNESPSEACSLAPLPARWTGLERFRRPPPESALGSEIEPPAIVDTVGTDAAERADAPPMRTLVLLPPLSVVRPTTEESPRSLDTSFDPAEPGGAGATSPPLQEAPGHAQLQSRSDDDTQQSASASEPHTSRVHSPSASGRSRARVAWTDPPASPVAHTSLTEQASIPACASARAHVAPRPVTAAPQSLSARDLEALLRSARPGTTPASSLRRPAKRNAPLAPRQLAARATAEFLALSGFAAPEPQDQQQHLRPLPTLAPSSPGAVDDSGTGDDATCVVGPTPGSARRCRSLSPQNECQPPSNALMSPWGRAPASARHGWGPAPMDQPECPGGWSRVQCLESLPDCQSGAIEVVALARDDGMLCAASPVDRVDMPEVDVACTPTDGTGDIDCPPDAINVASVVGSPSQPASPAAAEGLPVASDPVQRLPGLTARYSSRTPPLSQPNPLREIARSTASALAVAASDLGEVRVRPVAGGNSLSIVLAPSLLGGATSLGEEASSEAQAISRAPVLPLLRRPGTVAELHGADRAGGFGADSGAEVSNAPLPSPRPRSQQVLPDLRRTASAGLGSLARLPSRGAAVAGMGGISDWGVEAQALRPLSSSVGLGTAVSVRSVASRQLLRRGMRFAAAAGAGTAMPTTPPGGIQPEGLWGLPVNRDASIAGSVPTPRGRHTPPGASASQVPLGSAAVPAVASSGLFLAEPGLPDDRDDSMAAVGANRTAEEDL